jgi:hypothetical protein
MSGQAGTSGGTLVEPEPQAPRTGRPPVPAARPRLLWPLLLILAAGLLGLGVWAMATQPDTDSLGGAARVASDHDSWLSGYLAERADGAQAAVQLDPWIQQQLREREQAAAYVDPWAGQLRDERAGAVADQLDPWAQALVRDRE